MQQYIAFMRAINVGGRGIVKMTDLQAAFVAAGCQGARTFIQSGNVVFEANEKNTTALFQRIRTRVRDLLDDEPGMMFRTMRELERLLKADPFEPFRNEKTAKLYVTFLSRQPAARVAFPLVSTKEQLEAIGMTNLDVFIISRRKQNGFYGFPNNFIEKELGVSGTSRNWSTVTRLVQFARAETT